MKGMELLEQVQRRDDQRAGTHFLWRKYNWERESSRETLFWAFRIKKGLTRKIEDILPRYMVTEQGNTFKLKVSGFRQGRRGKLEYCETLEQLAQRSRECLIPEVSKVGCMGL